MSTRRRKPNPTKYAIVDNIDDDLYDKYDEMSPDEARAEMVKDLTWQAKVFKREDGYKVALLQGDEPGEYDSGPTAATRTGAHELKTAMLSVLNGEREMEAQLKAMRVQRKTDMEKWVKDTREQLRADQVELNGATDLKLEVGDTVILKGYDVKSWYSRRSAVKWTVMLLTDAGLTNWGRYGHSSQADAVMYSRDEAPGRMVVVKDGKVEQVRAGKPRATA